MSFGRALHSGLLGAVGGLVGTVTMSGVVYFAKTVGFLGRPPPALLTRRILHRFGVRPSRPSEKALTVAMHFAFGAGAGAIFGILDTVLLATRAPVVVGPIYGVAVWAANYAGWIPAVGLMAPPSLDRPLRPASMIAAHLVYGWTLAATHRALSSHGVVAMRAPEERDAQ